MAVEVRQLSPRPWGMSYPVVAYCNADGTVVHAADMTSGGGDTHWDRHGLYGSKAIVCIDCKQEGREVALQLPQYRDRAPFFRHPAGTAPDSRGHGETAEHITGKLLISDWARDQEAVLPWTVAEELWDPGARLRSDVRARLASGREVAFEVQRKDLAAGEWERRHGGYEHTDVADVWLWPPDAPRIELDLPGRSVVIEVKEERLGILVADYGGRYLHPTSGDYMTKPTHYASAPMSDWTLSKQGMLIPPPELDEHVGQRSGFERLSLLAQYRRNPYAGIPRVHGTRALQRKPEPSYAVVASSILHIRVRQAEPSPADDGLLKAVLRRARDRRDLLALGLYAAATAAPDAFRRMGERMLVASREEIELWCAVARHCESVLGDPSSTLESLAAAVEVQATVMETALALARRPIKDASDLFALRRKATRNIRRSGAGGHPADAGAVTYAVWATGYGKDAPQFVADEEADAIDMIAKNLPKLIERRQAVRAAVGRGKPLREAVAGVLAGDVP